VEKVIDPKRFDMLRVSGQHLTRIADDPSEALHPDNLTWMIGLDNSLMDHQRELPQRVREGSVERVLH
jgi:hypothetical protein